MLSAPEQTLHTLSSRSESATYSGLTDFVIFSMVGFIACIKLSLYLHRSSLFLMTLLCVCLLASIALYWPPRGHVQYVRTYSTREA